MIETIQYEQLPVAYTMFLLSIRIQGKFNPFPKYILCWTAFNSIYTYLGYSKKDLRPDYYRKNGEIEWKTEGRCLFPK